MIGKLFGWSARSKHAPSSSSLRSPAPQVHERGDSDAVDVMETWAASLPIDLILEIFLRLEPAAVIRCAAVCKPWQRAIIANASILGPHLDRFLGPSLLLGVFHYDRTAAYLQRTPGPFQSALPSNGGGGNETPANSLIPAAASAAFPTLLSSRDGFILLIARSVGSLCLCNPITGYCTIVPAAAAKHYKYILLTGSSSCSSSDDPVVRILAVHRKREISIMCVDDEDTLAYQVFSTSSDRAWLWGPEVQCSSDHLEPGRLWVRMDRRSTAVGQDTMYWLATGPRLEVTCVLALHVRSGRTWTTETPMQCRLPILGMSGDRRLYLVESLLGYTGHPQIKVWVLSSSGNAQWALQRTISIDKNNLPPRSSDMSWLAHLSAFCPRSRCVVALWSDQELLIDIGSSGSSPRIRRIGKRKEYQCRCCPYEMDCSTYISNMKHF